MRWNIEAMTPISVHVGVPASLREIELGQVPSAWVAVLVRRGE